MIHKGIIKGFRGSWFSGLAHLVIKDSETGAVHLVPCENGPTVRALEGCFGGVIGPGHTVQSEPGAGHLDQEIFWSYDEFGLILGGFTPVEGAHPEVLAAYEAQEVSI